MLKRKNQKNIFFIKKSKPCAHIPDGAADETQTHTENCHVPEIEGGLEKAIHPNNLVIFLRGTLKRTNSKFKDIF